MSKLTTFLICPVRDAEPGYVEKYVEQLEKVGFQVYWPARDTDQVDHTGGVRICVDNYAAIKDSDVVHVLWDGKSQGVLFDLGIAFSLGKNITVLDAPEPTDGKSFQNMMRHWDKFGLPFGPPAD